MDPQSIFRAFAGRRHLQFLDWLHDPRSYFREQV